MKVCKFGGSSLADAGQVAKACDIMASDPARRVVVVSAPGKRHGDDVKVTDLLIACAEARLAGSPTDEALARVVARYGEMARELELGDSVIAEIRADLEARLETGVEHRERFMCSMKAAGEDNCARLFAAALSSRGVPAHYLNPRDGGLLLSEEHGNAQILPESYEALAHIGDRTGVTVFPGFFGFTPEGTLVTFPRGGSDITGSVLAAAVQSELYENFTDIDSVFGADPRIVDNPEPVAEITFREMRELAYAGFTVLHDEAIQPAVDAGIPICIRNTNNPNAGGTMIVPERKYQSGRVVGIAASGDFCTVFVSKYLMNREVGFGRRLLQIFEEEGVSYEHTPSGIDNMSVILREANFDHEREQQIVARIRDEMDVDDVDVERGLSLAMIVGEGMRYSVGLVARAVTALADAGVNIEMINQGSSEISVMFGLKDVDRHKAVRALYGAFFGSGT